MEIKNALQASEAINEDAPLDATIVRSNAHDDSHPSRDRDFRTLGFP